MKTHSDSRMSLLDCSVVSGKSGPLLPSSSGSVVPRIECSVNMDDVCSHVIGTASSKVSGTDCFKFPGSGSSLVCPKGCSFMLKPNDVTIT